MVMVMVMAGVITVIMTTASIVVLHNMIGLFLHLRLQWQRYPDARVGQKTVFLAK